ncbi:serine-rich adhesin for platelets-like, partial [Trifolium medium]|nr:serine-rich adhesin for platelets-like [Trifolium medium]
VNCGAGEFGRYGGDAQAHLLNESLSVNCNETTQSNLEAVSQQQLQGEQLKIPNPSSVGEIASEKVNISDMSTSQPVHVTTLFSEGSPDKFILEINGASENESKIAEINDSQLPVDDQSGFIPRSAIEEEYEQVIDSKAIHDKVQEFELDRLTEDCITVSATACCTNVTNVSPERRHFPENNVKNLHLTPQLCPTVKAGCDSGVNDMPIDNSSTIPESQIRDDNVSTDTSIHCEVQCDVPGNIEQQATE